MQNLKKPFKAPFKTFENSKKSSCQGKVVHSRRVSSVRERTAEPDGIRGLLAQLQNRGAWESEESFEQEELEAFREAERGQGVTEPVPESLFASPNFGLRLTAPTEDSEKEVSENFSKTPNEDIGDDIPMWQIEPEETQDADEQGENPLLELKLPNHENFKKFSATVNIKSNISTDLITNVSNKPLASEMPNIPQRYEAPVESNSALIEIPELIRVHPLLAYKFLEQAKIVKQGMITDKGAYTKRVPAPKPFVSPIPPKDQLGSNQKNPAKSTVTKISTCQQPLKPKVSEGTVSSLLQQASVLRNCQNPQVVEKMSGSPNRSSIMSCLTFNQKSNQVEASSERIGKLQGSPAGRGLMTVSPDGSGTHTKQSGERESSGLRSSAPDKWNSPDSQLRFADNVSTSFTAKFVDPEKHSNKPKQDPQHEVKGDSSSDVENNLMNISDLEVEEEENEDSSSKDSKQAASSRAEVLTLGAETLPAARSSKPEANAKPDTEFQASQLSPPNQIASSSGSKEKFDHQSLRTTQADTCDEGPRNPFYNESISSPQVNHPLQPLESMSTQIYPKPSKMQVVPLPELSVLPSLPAVSSADQTQQQALISTAPPAKDLFVPMPTVKSPGKSKLVSTVVCEPPKELEKADVPAPEVQETRLQHDIQKSPLSKLQKQLDLEVDTVQAIVPTELAKPAISPTKPTQRDFGAGNNQGPQMSDQLGPTPISAAHPMTAGLESLSKWGWKNSGVERADSAMERLRKKTRALIFEDQAPSRAAPGSEQTIVDVVRGVEVSGFSNWNCTHRTNLISTAIEAIIDKRDLVVEIGLRRDRVESVALACLSWVAHKDREEKARYKRKMEEAASKGVRIRYYEPRVVSKVFYFYSGDGKDAQNLINQLGWDVETVFFKGRDKLCSNQQVRSKCKGSNSLRWGCQSAITQGICAQYKQHSCDYYRQRARSDHAAMIFLPQEYYAEDQKRRELLEWLGEPEGKHSIVIVEEAGELATLAEGRQTHSRNGLGRSVEGSPTPKAYQKKLDAESKGGKNGFRFSAREVGFLVGQLNMLVKAFPSHSNPGLELSKTMMTLNKFKGLLSEIKQSKVKWSLADLQSNLGKIFPADNFNKSLAAFVADMFHILGLVANHSELEEDWTQLEAFAEMFRLIFNFLQPDHASIFDQYVMFVDNPDPLRVENPHNTIFISPLTTKPGLQSTKLKPRMTFYMTRALVSPDLLSQELGVAISPTNTVPLIAPTGVICDSHKSVRVVLHITPQLTRCYEGKPGQPALPPAIIRSFGSIRKTGAQPLKAQAYVSSGVAAQEEWADKRVLRDVLLDTLKKCASSSQSVLLATSSTLVYRIVAEGGTLRHPKFRALLPSWISILAHDDENSLWSNWETSEDVIKPVSTKVPTPSNIIGTSSPEEDTEHIPDLCEIIRRRRVEMLPAESEPEKVLLQSAGDKRRATKDSRENRGTINSSVTNISQKPGKYGDSNSKYPDGELKVRENKIDSEQEDTGQKDLLAHEMEKLEDPNETEENKLEIGESPSTCNPQIQLDEPPKYSTVSQRFDLREKRETREVKTKRRVEEISRTSRDKAIGGDQYRQEKIRLSDKKYMRSRSRDYRLRDNMGHIDDQDNTSSDNNLRWKDSEKPKRTASQRRLEEESERTHRSHRSRKSRKSEHASSRKHIKIKLENRSESEELSNQSLASGPIKYSRLHSGRKKEFDSHQRSKSRMEAREYVTETLKRCFDLTNEAALKSRLKLDETNKKSHFGKSPTKKSELPRSKSRHFEESVKSVSWLDKQEHMSHKPEWSVPEPRLGKHSPKKHSSLDTQGTQLSTAAGSKHASQYLSKRPEPIPEETPELPSGSHSTTSKGNSISSVKPPKASREARKRLPSTAGRPSSPSTEQPRPQKPLAGVPVVVDMEDEVRYRSNKPLATKRRQRRGEVVAVDEEPHLLSKRRIPALSDNEMIQSDDDRIQSNNLTKRYPGMFEESEWSSKRNPLVGGVIREALSSLSKQESVATGYQGLRRQSGRAKEDSERPRKKTEVQPVDAKLVRLMTCQGCALVDKANLLAACGHTFCRGCWTDGLAKPIVRCRKCKLAQLYNTLEPVVLSKSPQRPK